MLTHQGTDRHVNTSGNQGHLGVGSRSGNRTVGVTQKSRWTYASYSSTRVLVFDGDKLVGIEDPAGDD